MEKITELQNLNDKLYKVVKILKRKQENEELLTVQADLVEEIADHMRELLSNSIKRFDEIKG
jgi:hypothetical protein